MSTYFNSTYRPMTVTDRLVNYRPQCATIEDETEQEETPEEEHDD